MNSFDRVANDGIKNMEDNRHKGKGSNVNEICSYNKLEGRDGKIYMSRDNDAYFEEKFGIDVIR